MSLYHGSRIGRNGLVLYLDAPGIKSYPGSGTTWFDLSGNGNNITLVNGPTYTSGVTGYFTFDGTNDQGNLTTSINADPNFLSAFAWIYRNDSSTVDVIFGTTGKYASLELSVDGKLNFQTQSGGFFQIETAASTILNSNWYHVGVTRGASDRLYVNGVQVVSGTNSQGRSFGTIDRIGQTFNSNYFNGRMSNIAVYNRELSAAEVGQNFEAHRGRYNI